MDRTPRSLAILGTFLLIEAAGPSGGQTAREFRFHHLHLSVEDPGLALDAVANTLGGTKTILQGHGAGVRLAGEYVIVDREDRNAAERRSARARARDTRGASSYEEARLWLTRGGARVWPEALGDTGIVPAVPLAPLNAIAFAVKDLPAAVLELTERGESPIARSDDGARYRLASGLVVEVIADTEGADAFWCPMHPAIRAPRESRCSLCGMRLVPIPPPRIGEYKMDVIVTPGPNGRGISRLRFGVRDPDTERPVREFVDVHERPFHVFVISSDLERFVHGHPRQLEDGAFELVETFDDGVYLILGDFVPAGGTPQMLHRVVTTQAHAGAMFAAVPALKAGPAEQVSDGLRIRLEASDLFALKPARLVFKVADADSGAPTTDLEPYLGASGHLLLVSPDLTAAIHGHPDGSPTAGPDVVFDPILPAPGIYKLWVQFQRRGRVVTVPFVVRAR